MFKIQLIIRRSRLFGCWMHFLKKLPLYCRSYRFSIRIAFLRKFWLATSKMSMLSFLITQKQELPISTFAPNLFRVLESFETSKTTSFGSTDWSKKWLGRNSRMRNCISCLKPLLYCYSIVGLPSSLRSGTWLIVSSNASLCFRLLKGSECYSRTRSGQGCLSRVIGVQVCLMKSRRVMDSCFRNTRHVSTLTKFLGIDSKELLTTKLATMHSYLLKFSIKPLKMKLRKAKN